MHEMYENMETTEKDDWQIPLAAQAVTSDIGVTLTMHAYREGTDDGHLADYLDRVDEFQEEDFPYWQQMQWGDELGIDWENDPRVEKITISGSPAYRLDLGNGWVLTRYSIARDDPERVRSLLKEGVYRDTGYGDGFTSLSRKSDGGQPMVWMSDTRAEIREHYPVIKALNSMAMQRLHEDGEPLRILINGLGLGMIAHFALSGFDEIGRVDVVEIDETLIAAIGPLLADDRLHIHHADAYTVEWEEGETWDYAWHDIWPTISEDNITEMEQLFEKYAGRVGQQDAWEYQKCLDMRERSVQFRQALERGDWEKAKEIDPDF